MSHCTPYNAENKLTVQLKFVPLENKLTIFAFTTLLGVLIKQLDIKITFSIALVFAPIS